jgi:RNA polymerase sigma factor (sigma-70 family)
MRTAELPDIKKAEPKSQKWTDARLIKACVDGNQEAWSVLIEKYKKMIYSVPVRHGFNSEDSADIFQSVCEELLAQLPKHRQARFLSRWILNVASQICLRRKFAGQNTQVNTEENGRGFKGPLPAEAEAIIIQGEQDQVFRQAVSELPLHRNQMIQSLFFDPSPRPYAQLARELCASGNSLRAGRQAFLERLRRRAKRARA